MDHTNFAVSCHHSDFFEYILHFSAICTRIHHNSSSKCTRDPSCELKTCKRSSSGRHSDGRKKRSRCCTDLCTIYCDLLHIAVQLDNHASVPLVADQKIASVSKYEIWQLFLSAYLKRLTHFFYCSRHHKNICRTADTKSCMFLHRLIKEHLLCS